MGSGTSTCPNARRMYQTPQITGICGVGYMAGKPHTNVIAVLARSPITLQNKADHPLVWLDQLQGRWTWGQDPVPTYIPKVP